MLILVVELRKP